MDVYRQAAEILQLVRDGKGTAKALCLRKEMQKKRQTYAVVCETLRHFALLEDVLATAEFFKYYPKSDRALAMVLAFDTVVGKGVKTRQHNVAIAITESAQFLQSAYQRVKDRHQIAPPTHLKDMAAFDEGGAAPANGRGGRGAAGAGGEVGRFSTAAAGLPKYARVNTLLTTVGEAMQILDKRARKRAREEAGEAAPEEDIDEAVDAAREYTLDPDIPCLLRFPHASNIQAHPLVKYGKLILQDKASCIPPCVLLDAVRVDVEEEIAAAREGMKPLEYVIDACAAPGNKTTQLAALGLPNGIKLMAVEKDTRRVALLEQRVQQMGANEHINVMNADFFQLSSADRECAEAILLDPSCSASGVVSRVDIALAADARSRRGPRQTNDDGEEETPEDAEGHRVESLSRLQRKMLAHALLSFKNCRRVVYSTCSVHEAENEGVVRTVLEDERVAKMGWRLSHIMPTWPTRGHRLDTDALPLHHTIRCDPCTDETNGFFVACFDRIIGGESGVEKEEEKNVDTTEQEQDAEAEEEGEGEAEEEVEEEE